MTLTELAIKRPSFIIVIFTILVGGGLLSYKQLSYELMPDFSAPLLTITTAYPGASPSTVESQVSKPLEDVLSGMENVDEVTSFSFDNASFVLPHSSTEFFLQSVFSSLRFCQVQCSSRHN